MRKPNTVPTLNSSGTGIEVAPTPTEEINGLPQNYLFSRGIANWLHRLIGAWLAWLFSGLHSRADIGPDHFIPVTRGAVKLLPSTTSGTLNGVTGARTGLIGGDKSEAPSVARIYAANADTYFDLQRDGDWSIQVVAAMAAAPPVAADTLRSHYVRTDGVEITLVTDLGDDAFGDRAAIDVPGAYTDSLEVARGKLTSDAEAARPGLIHRARLILDGAFNLVEEAGSALLANFRRYHYNDSATLQSHYQVHGASYDGTIWTLDTANQDAYLYRFHDGGWKIYRHPKGGSATWAHSLGVAGAWEELFDVGASGNITVANNVSAGGNFIGDSVIAGGNLSAVGQASATHFIPSSNPVGVPAAHGLYRSNTPKAWARVRVVSGSISIDDSYGVVSAGFAGTNLELTLSRAMANATYAVQVTVSTVGDIPFGNSSANNTVVAGVSSYADGNAVDLTGAGDRTFNITVFGNQ